MGMKITPHYKGPHRCSSCSRATTLRSQVWGACRGKGWTLDSLAEMFSKTHPRHSVKGAVNALAEQRLLYLDGSFYRQTILSRTISGRQLQRVA